MAKEKISVSIIMPSYGLENIEKVIGHILKQEYENKEIILINDNPNSAADAKISEFLRKNKIRLINNPVNLGIAESLNQGIKNSKSDAIVILCKDYFPRSRSWIKDIIRELYSDDKLGCVTTPIIWPREEWMKCDFLTKLFTFRHVGNIHYGGGNYKREVFNKIGLFNSSGKFKFSGEDADMHERLHKAGYLMGQVNSPVNHLHFEKGGNPLSFIRKELRYGEAHGVLKRDRPFRRIGLFDFEFRMLAFIGLAAGWILNPVIGWASLLILLAAAMWQTINALRDTRWLPGIVFYPIVSLFVMFIQTFGAVLGFARGRADI